MLLGEHRFFTKVIKKNNFYVNLSVEISTGRVFIYSYNELKPIRQNEVNICLY